MDTRFARQRLLSAGRIRSLACLLVLTLTLSSGSLSVATMFTPRWREGQTIERLVGTVVRSGNRHLFVAENGTRLTLLENLSLQRVIGYLADDEAPYQWTVSGQITEFQGSNYLLLQTAHVASATSTPDN